MVLDRFHPAVANWFIKQFARPTEPQAKAWPAIKDRRHTLIAAPTGSGKTLSAFLAAIDDLVRQGIDGKLEDATQVVYVSPLKALSNDIQRNLQQPLEGIQAELRAMGFPEFEIRSLVRTGDTPSAERAKMTRRPPHIIVTTPESLYLLLTSEGGRKIPPQLQRMESEDLLAAVFPDQVACGENIVGDRDIPDHPLVAQTIRDCLEEAMDIEGLEALLASIEKGEKILVARDLREPSPLSMEILNARPYAFLDDAPLEERRTQAVMSRRWLDPETAADLGTLDQAAIDQVREESWPQAESADELHDILLQLGFITAIEGFGWEEYFAELAGERRAAGLHVGEKVFWVAAERLPHLLAVYTDAKLEPEIMAPAKEITTVSPDAMAEGLIEILRGRLEAIGPVTAESLVETMALPVYAIESALMSLESEGFVMRGRFTPGASSTTGATGPIEWCVRRLLARIHRYTLNRLRKEIEPVSPADFMRFLLSWQQVAPGDRGEGPESLSAIVDQLEGFEAAAGAWEGEILPTRLESYEPEWLDSLCLSGRIVWTRLSPQKGAVKSVGSGPVRSTPIALLNRKNLAAWDIAFPQPKANDDLESMMSSSAQLVYDHLLRHGASFFTDFVDNTGLLKTQVEEGLAGLVAGGLITADSFTGLRALLTPSNKRPSNHNAKRKAPAALFGMENAGRWSRVRRGGQSLNGSGFLASGKTGAGSLSITDGAAVNAEMVERIARVLLRRYGVVFRKLMDREGMTLPWREF